MAADVLQKVISANSIKYGDAIINTGAKRGATGIQKNTNLGINRDSIETSLFNILDRRLDDTTYYTA